MVDYNVKSTEIYVNGYVQNAILIFVAPNTVLILCCIYVTLGKTVKITIRSL